MTSILLRKHSQNSKSNTSHDFKRFITNSIPSEFSKFQSIFCIRSTKFSYYFGNTTLSGRQKISEVSTEIGHLQNTLRNDTREVNAFQISEYEMSYHDIKHKLIKQIKFVFAIIIKPTTEKNEKYSLNYKAMTVNSCLWK